MTGGVVFAAAATARTERIAAIVDAFRLAGATEPAGAEPFEELGLERSAEIQRLIKRGILVPVRKSAAWYLSEATYTDYRNSMTTRTTRIIIVIAVLTLTLVTFAVAYFSAGSPG